MLKKILSPAEALAKASRYCAYQERSHQEVRDKLYGYGLHRNEVEEALTELITQGYLNEERFAKAFAGGKFRMKKWGKVKIELELKRKRLSPRCIAIGLKEIDANSYKKALGQILNKALKAGSSDSAYVQKNKAARVAIAKGYEPDLVWDMIQTLQEE